MIRLGIVDFDTSHAVEFTKRLNHVDIAEDQWVEGARVVAGVPGSSQISPEVIGPNTATLKKYGIEILDDPAALFGKIDAVLIESVDGSVHLEVSVLTNVSASTEAFCGVSRHEPFASDRRSRRQAVPRIG